MADVGHGPGRIVGHRLDDQRDAGWSVALVRDLLDVLAGELSGSLLDRAIDVLLRQRLGLARLDRHAQSRVPRRIAATHLGGHRDLTNQLGEERTTLGVGRRLVVLDLLPFTVASHTSLVVGSSPVVR